MSTLRTLLGGLVLAAPLVGVGTAAEAQTAPVSSGPPGSYQQSCVSYSFDAASKRLYASCRKSDGSLNPTQLLYGPCGTADISNVNGQLRCATGPVPTGTWRTWCPDAWVYGTQLRANCRMAPIGPSSYSELEFGKCKGPIGLARNMLTCDQGVPIPQGSYLQSCTVVRFVDDTVWTDCKKQDGTPNFNMINNVSQCVGDIENDGGIPKCSTGGAPPPGSYAASCSSIFRFGDKLNAKCRLSSGTAVRASTLASISACNGADIFNEDGFLKCIPAAAASKPAPAPPPRTAAPPPPPAPAPTPTISKPAPPPATLKTAPPNVILR